MKIKIVSDTLGGTPPRHLQVGAVVDLDVADAAPLCQAGRAVLLDAEDRPELLRHLKAEEARAHRLAGGSFR